MVYVSLLIIVDSAGVDLETISDRMQVRTAVQGGEIDAAIEQVNDMNPNVSMAERSYLANFCRF